MGGSDRFRDKIINQIKPFGFLFFIKSNQTAHVLKPNRNEPVRFGSITFFFFNFPLFFSHKNGSSIGKRCWTSSNGVKVRVFFK